MPDDANAAALPLLNVYEVEAEDQGGPTRHLLAFLEPVRAGAEGLSPRSIVGEVTPTDYGGFDPTSLRHNPEFLESIAAYMNEVIAGTDEVVRQARASGTGWAYIVDPRNHDGPGTPPPPADVIGAFAIGEAGQVAPGSFHYNAGHALIDPDRGLSGLLSDRRFYDWLHPTTDPA
jgi:hypothetical protein